MRGNAQDNNYHMIYVFKNEGCLLGLCLTIRNNFPKKLINPGCQIAGQPCISPTIDLGS